VATPSSRYRVFFWNNFQADVLEFIEAAAST
jgi:hypothetical protein